jgi:cell division protein ZapE
MLAAYTEHLSSGILEEDLAQERVAAHLSALSRALADWRPDAWFSRRAAPRGLYIWGPVGGGKSLLMDIFFGAAPVAKKRRVHFHEFMLARHEFLREARARETTAHDDLIARAARHVAQDARLLCLDELQVSDIADAMILGRLFERLLERNVVIVVTSNRRPGDLYGNGVNRQLFLPFIALLEEKLDIVELDAGCDYRLERLMAAPVYHAPLGPAADAATEAAWGRLTHGAAAHALTLDVQGRKLFVARQAAGVARLTFAELCEQPRGAADYLKLAEIFHTVILENVPRMTPAMREEAARFRILVDALYEARTKLVMSADAEPRHLYPQGDQSFEFERTASRLMEMRSETYLALPRNNQSP